MSTEASKFIEWLSTSLNTTTNADDPAIVTRLFFKQTIPRRGPVIEINKYNEEARDFIYKDGSIVCALKLGIKWIVTTNSEGTHVATTHELDDFVPTTVIIDEGSIERMRAKGDFVIDARYNSKPVMPTTCWHWYEVEPHWEEAK